MAFELTKELLENVSQAVEEKDALYLQPFFVDQHIADINTILEHLNTEQALFCFDLISFEKRAELISYLEPDTRIPFLKNFTSEQLASYIEAIDSDDAADILNEQKNKTKEEVLSLISDEKCTFLRDLLRYDENTAGGLMAKELVRCNIAWTVKRCTEEIRNLSGIVEKVFSVYVVDDKGMLLGWMPMKKLLLASEKTPIAEIYSPEIISIKSYKDDDEVAEVMQKYDLESIPVVDIKHTLLGRITIDDVVDVITEQAEKEKQLMAGVSESVESTDSIWTISRSRLPWLIIGMLGGLLGAQVMGFFEGDLIQVPAMAFFIPLIMATGGNVGIQSSSLVVQSLADKSDKTESLRDSIWKALLVAIINGLVISTLMFGLNALFNGQIDIAFVVAVALFSVIILSSLMGTITPLILEKFKINPALASGPFITTCNDLLGIAVYFFVARLLIM